MLEHSDQIRSSDALHKALEMFRPISLEESQRAALMDRGEVKYLLNTKILFARHF